MRTYMLALGAAAAFALAGPALAVDLPVKATPAAPPAAALLDGYPFTGSGFYIGINTLGAGQTVSTSASPNGGVPASATAISGDIGGTVGFSWGKGNVFYAVEAVLDWQNLNSQGLGISGPASFEERFKIGTPVANLLSMFPSLNLPNLPTLPVLPKDVTVLGTTPYLTAGLHEDDISASFGLTHGREWSIAPSVGFGALNQLSNKVAADVWVEYVAPGQGFCVGPSKCATSGQQVRAGFGLYY